jgi:hypothetical protein
VGNPKKRENRKLWQTASILNKELFFSKKTPQIMGKNATHHAPSFEGQGGK